MSGREASGRSAFRWHAFPRPFTSLRTISGGRPGRFTVGAMFTEPYSSKAERLAASCETFGLHYELHQVAAVHNSISPRGTDDLSYTKANFIRHLIASHRKPVLYVDADCEFMSRPDLIDDLARSGCDFAIYNWCADDYNDRFAPIDLGAVLGQPSTGRRFWRFGGAVDRFTDKQIVCSGLVQFYADSLAARGLLKSWQRTLATFPGCEDDAALAFAFNNIGRRSWLHWLLKPRWLPKAYARIGWWIYVKPVINHEDIPRGYPGFATIEDADGRCVSYPSLMEIREADRLFPRDCIIDTEGRQLCKLVGRRLVPVGPTKEAFWI